jgi:P63C domain
MTREAAIVESEAPNQKIVQALHGSPDHPLRIADLEIPCYVLEDGRRVLIRSAMIKALNMSEGSAHAGLEGDRIVKFVSTKSIKPYVSDALIKSLREPIIIRTPSGSIAHASEATILADLCEAVLEARQNGKLNFQQIHIAKQCEILVRGFARVGIIALVDEVTGYQDFRSRQALEEILEKFISDEFVKWTKMFPDDFYKELFRLRGWQYSPLSVKRPQVVGHLTNDIVYQRLAPGVLTELKRLVPKDEKTKRRKRKLFQRLTEDVGHDRLREHLASVTTLMRASANWGGFYRLLERALPKYKQTLPLPFPDQNDDQDESTD